MNNNYNNGPVITPIDNQQQNNAYTPITPLGYLGYQLLFCIPLVGIVMAIYYGFNEGNINRRNYARAFLISFAFSMIFALILITVFGFSISKIINFNFK